MQKTLVVGASTNPGRYSNTAIRRLVANNVETTAFGIRGGTVSGVQIKDNLGDFQNIDTVTLYLNPKNQKEYYQPILVSVPDFLVLINHRPIKVNNPLSGNNS